MKTLRVSLLGIPAHPLTNDLPGTLLPAASVCDLLYLLKHDPSWANASFRLLQLGNAGALLAGALGALDFLRLPPTPDVRRIGWRHAALNTVLLPLFGLCQMQRRRRPERPSASAVALLLAANVGLNLSAWYGARLVHQYGVRTGEPSSAGPLAIQVEPITW